MKVSVAGKGDEYFAHVISTSTFTNLSIINTERVPMTYIQRQAIRTLNYELAVKVGIRFKTCWWEQGGLNQRGGSSFTDRPSRTIVYPSAGLDKAGPGVLMATYNWCILSWSTFAYSELTAQFNLAGSKTLTASVPSSRNPTGPSNSTQIVNALGPKKFSSTSSTQILARFTVCQSSSSGQTHWTTMHLTGTTTRSPWVPMRTLPLGSSVPSLRASCSLLRIIGSILWVRWQVRTMRGLRECWTWWCGWWMRLSAGISQLCYPGLRRSMGGAWCLVMRRVQKWSLFAGCFRRSWRRLRSKLWVLVQGRKSRS